ncbi:hypothetical protein BCV72DRAFT_204424 [Rhizopus microsporus var. microsporus]|uniref:Uncharacterized protein n=1 Tax=Rhizopus microsporus var. microsporus TaxID=86635 RepID=A0A1X0R7M0_RHIZD|nr:hypothetical protein BCV72DRAFT_204424 [Rhizopus microsporus var. microsporus]
MRARLLQSRVDRLHDRVLVGRVYVSVSSFASDEFKKRDKKGKCDVINMLNNVDGNKHTSNKEVCLAAVNHADQSASISDIKNLSGCIARVSKIIIDNLPWKNEATILTRQQTMTEATVLSAFNYRASCIKSST